MPELTRSDRARFRFGPDLEPRADGTLRRSEAAALRRGGGVPLDPLAALHPVEKILRFPRGICDRRSFFIRSQVPYMFDMREFFENRFAVPVEGRPSRAG